MLKEQIQAEKMKELTETNLSFLKDDIAKSDEEKGNTY